MQSALARLSHVVLAINHDLDHLRDLLQAANDDLVALDEAIAMILDTCF